MAGRRTVRVRTVVAAVVSASLVLVGLPGSDVLAADSRPVAPTTVDLPLRSMATQETPRDLPTPRHQHDSLATDHAASAPRAWAYTGTRAFRLVGLTWDAIQPITADRLAEDHMIVWVRHLSQGKWSQWYELDVPTDHSPDPGSSEVADARPGTDPLFVPESTGVEIAIETPEGHIPAGATVHLIDPGAAPADAQASAMAGTAHAATRPLIYTRADWGADESLKRCCTEYGAVQAGFVHHTVSSNAYSADEVPAIIRSIYAFHVEGRGWRDIGYNFLVDRFGRIWEGRSGGMDKAVTGAHASGVNEVSVGASVIGDYGTATPSRSALDGLSRLFAWKFDLHGIDPMATVSLKGKPMQAISGHRDANSTLCPGDQLYARLPEIRTTVASLMAAFTPIAAGSTFAKTAYSPEIYSIAPDGSVDHLTYRQWTAAGSPTPTIVPGIPGTTYVTTTWSPEIYAVQPSGTAYRLTDSQWTAAGSPAVATVALVPGTVVAKTAYSPEIYAVDPGGTVHHLTYSEWTAAGSPTPTTVPEIPGTTYVTTTWSPEIYAVQPSGTAYRLTYSQWTAAGSPTPTTVPEIPGTTYVTTTWSTAIYAVQPSGTAYRLTYSQWTSLGSPTPTTVGHVPGTRYVRASWSPSLYAVLPGIDDGFWLDGDQWAAAGYPIPTTVGHVPGTTYTTYEGDPRIFAHTPDGKTHLLTYGEWVAAGRPSPTVVAQPLGRLVKVAWSPNVYELADDGTGRWITYDEYVAAGYPPITTVTSVPPLNEVTVPKNGQFTMDGRGYGHGRGLSQWGAYRAGTQGVAWTNILAAYYPGTSRSSGPTGDLRVRLEGDTGEDLIVRPESGLRILWTNQGGQQQNMVAPTNVNGCSPAWWRVRMVNSDLAIEYLCGQIWGTWQGPGVVDGNRAVTFQTSDSTIDTAIRTPSGFVRKGYRGHLEGLRSGSDVLVTNVVPVESYLRSVVANEVPPSWPTQTLRAQAVAARTYALRERYDRSSQSFHVYDSTRSQVYPGLVLYDSNWNVVDRYEDPRTDEAVSATAGVGLLSGGVPAFTQFSSSNGGWSAAGAQSYLPLRRDDWDWQATANPYREWSSSISASSLQSRYPQVGTVSRVRVVQRDGGGYWGGRIVKLVIEGSVGSATVSGDSAIRAAFGTRSSYFTFD